MNDATPAISRPRIDVRAGRHESGHATAVGGADTARTDRLLLRRLRPGRGVGVSARTLTSTSSCTTRGTCWVPVPLTSEPPATLRYLIPGAVGGIVSFAFSRVTIEPLIALLSTTRGS